MNKLILVIPDGHNDEVHPLDRWRSLGKLITDRKPDLIVQLGDFASINSLSHFDMNKRRLMENKRFSKEIAACRQAMDLLFDPLTQYWVKQKRSHVKRYTPEIIWCEGNHEARVESYLDVHAQLEGQLELDLAHNLNYSGYPIDLVVPYKDYVIKDGIAFTHAPINAAGAPVTGKMALHRASELFATSLVFGHLHRLTQLDIFRHGGDILQIISAGCFFEHTDTYAKGAANVYRRGVLLLHQWDIGRFDVEEISIARLKAEYV